MPWARGGGGWTWHLFCPNVPPVHYLPGTDLVRDRSTHRNVASRNCAEPLARQIEGDTALSFCRHFFSQPHRQINTPRH